MAKSTYYYLLNKVDTIAIRNEAVLKEIKIIFTENKGLYGVRRVHNELINRGFKVNHKRVQNLMNKDGKIFIAYTEPQWCFVSLLAFYMIVLYDYIFYFTVVLYFTM